MNTPLFNITSKILNLVGQISETVALLDDTKVSKLPLILRKENRIKTITGTLEIEGNTLGIEKITQIIEGKRVLGSTREIEEVL